MKEILNIINAIYDLEKESENIFIFHNSLFTLFEEYEIEVSFDSDKGEAIEFGKKKYFLSSDSFTQNDLGIISTISKKILENYTLNHFNTAITNTPLPAALIDYESKKVILKNELYEQLNIGNQDTLHCSPDRNFLRFCDKCPLNSNDIVLQNGDEIEEICDFLQIKFKYKFIEDKNRLLVLLVFLDYDQSNEEKTLLSTVKDLEFQHFAVDSTFFIEYYDEDLKIKYANQLYCDRLGYSIGELIGKSYNFNDAGYHSNEYHRDLINTVTSGTVWKGLNRIYSRNKEDIWLSKTIMPVPNDPDIPYSYIVLSTEVTTLKKSENDLLLLTQVFEQTPVSIMITDERGKLQYVNPYFEKISGYTLSEIVGKTSSFLKSGYTPDDEYELLWKTIRRGKVWHGQFCNKKKNGQIYWEFASIAPVKDFNGKINSYIAIKEDITHLKKTEHILESNNALLETVFNSISEGIVAFDVTDRVSIFNHRFTDLFEIDKHDIENIRKSELINILQNQFEKGKEFRDFVEESTKHPEELHTKLFKLKNNKFYDFAISPQYSYNKVFGSIWAFNDYTTIQYIQNKLIENNKDLKTINRKLDSKTKTLQSTVKELELQKNIAESAIKAKNEFLTNISHEIRTPMNSILGFTQILKNQISEVKHKSFLDAVESSGNNLMILLNDLLDLSKIEAGKMLINVQLVPFFKLSKEINNIFGLEAKNKNLDLKVDFEDGLPHSVYIDEIRVRQILFNLLGNAIKFTKEGYIKVAFAVDKIKDDVADLLITVSDSGIGIEEELQKTIFDIFYQKPEHIQNQVKGTGLGLAISNKLAHLMDGNISLKSEVGVGSEFCLRLKNVRYTDGNSQTRPFKQQSIKQFEDVIKVLVVDDILLNRKLIVEFLNQKNCKIYEAKSGDDALEICKFDRPDIVFMDIQMPKMTGIETTKKLRDMYPDLTIIAITASVSYSSSEFRGYGFDDFITKPLEQHEIIQSIITNLNLKSIDKKSLTQSDGRKIEFNKIKDAKSFIEKLEEAKTIWNVIRKNNKLSDIKNWSNVLQDVAKQYECSELVNYCKYLNECLEDFDFEQIPEEIAKFPLLLERIKLSSGEK